MKGSIDRLIRKTGVTITVRNSGRSGDARETPNYSDDGEMEAILERRSRPQEVQTSAGETVYSELQLRALPESTITLAEPGDSDYWPTRFSHPNGRTYELVAEYTEANGVSVLNVVRV